MVNNLDIKKKIIIIIVAVSIIVGVVAVGVMEIKNDNNSITITETGKSDEKANNQATDKKMEENQPKKDIILVHIVGAVMKPNMYQLTDGARVYDAIKLANPTKDADLSQVNLAEKVRDEMKITVPRKGEVVSSSNTSLADAKSNKINLNTATESQIEELEGIGPALAKRIIEYRQANSGFRSIDDLKNVTGIGEKKFAQLKNQVTV